MPPFHILGPDRPSRWLVTCDHASNRVPEDVCGGDLGVSAQDMTRHIAWDVGARGLAEAVQSKKIRLKKMEELPNEIVREQLIQLKGIGNWTIDVYLMHALRRTDLFPLGDIALVNSLKHIKKLNPEISKEKMLQMAEPWRPYRTIAAMILWHDYLKRRGTKIQN